MTSPLPILNVVGLARAREAELIMDVDSVGAHQALGAICTLLFDVEGVRSHFKIASQIAPRNVNVLNNYSVSLHQLGFFSEAFEYANTVAELVPEDLRALRQARDNAFFAGDLNNARLLDEMHAFRGGKEDDDACTIGDVIKSLGKSGVAQSELATGQRLMFDLLRERKVRFKSIEFGVTEADGDTAVAYTVRIRASLNDAIELGDELAVQLSDQIADWHPWALVFDFIGQGAGD
ncbi:MAG: hypothetical protein IPJ25_14950 [Rhodocyclaceae bacterium]|nr:hypothetical protein [Rhodocyclaceae bacterium]